MYAIHHGADVVNLSVGPSFKGLNQLPVEQQNEIAKRQFKNLEKLWARVCALAAKKNCILVFAAMMTFCLVYLLRTEMPHL